MSYSAKKYFILLLQILLCSFLFISCSNKTSKSKLKNADNHKQFKTLAEITQSKPNKSSFSQRVAKIRAETELLDDRTEQMLARNKKWFALGFVFFLWLAFQSLINYRQEK